MKKLNNKQILEKELTQLWKEKCVETYEPYCESCGQPATVFHHFIPKGRCLAMKFDIKNGVALCQRCHYLIHFGHKPTEIADIVNAIRESRGKEWCDYIKGRERETISKTIGWLNEQKDNLLNI